MTVLIVSSQQDEGEDARRRSGVDSGVHRAAPDDDIARHFEPINGPDVKPDDAIGSVEWHYRFRTFAGTCSGNKVAPHPDSADCAPPPSS
jgi:hypothetical protein